MKVKTIFKLETMGYEIENISVDQLLELIVDDLFNAKLKLKEKEEERFKKNLEDVSRNPSN